MLPGPNITRILTPVVGIVYYALSCNAFCLSLHGKKPLKLKHLMVCWRISIIQNSGFLKPPPCDRAWKTMPKTSAKFRCNILSRLHTLHMENSWEFLNVFTIHANEKDRNKIRSGLWHYLLCGSGGWGGSDSPSLSSDEEQLSLLFFKMPPFTRIFSLM